MVAQRVKRLPVMWETWVRSLGQEDPLEKEMATHSNILVWKILWTEEPGAGYRPCGVAKSRIRLSDFTSLSVFPRKPFPRQKKKVNRSLIGLSLWTWSIKEKRTSSTTFKNPRDCFLLDLPFEKENGLALLDRLSLLQIPICGHVRDSAHI